MVTSGNQDQLWHWFFDIVPRLELLQRHAPADCPIYVDQRHSFQRDSLALFGIDPERILSANDTPLVRARRLIVPCYGVANGQRVPDSVRDLLRGRFLPKEPAAQAKKRIYVGRGDAAHRRIRNEEELLERLRPLGFEHHVLAKLPLPDQVRLYRDAEIVIGGHGSGLAHLVFCDPGTTVIEFHPAASRDFYYRVSRAAGLRYYYVKARGGDRMDPDPEAYAIEQDDLLNTLALVGF